MKETSEHGFWVDIKLALKKGLKFYQTRSNAIILHETLPAYCLPKVVLMETGEVIYEKVYASPRPPPKISLKHDWMRELGSEVAQRPDGRDHVFRERMLEHDRDEEVCRARDDLADQDYTYRMSEDGYFHYSFHEFILFCCR